MRREIATCSRRVCRKNVRDFHRENGWRVFGGLYERARLGQLINRTDAHLPASFVHLCNRTRKSGLKPLNADLRAE